MQAIITKYLPPTNYRGARIKAECQRGSNTISQPIEMNNDEAHTEAAKVLIEKFVEEDRERYGSDEAGNAWNRPFVSGVLPSGDYVHVFLD